MNSPLNVDPSRNSNSRNRGACPPGFSASAEDTLRLIASLPAPDGLADRVQAGLRTAPRSASVLRWPDALRHTGGWMHNSMARGAAAAAIVFVVAGGGWGVYSRVQLAPTSKVVVMPARVGASGGFSSANAKRVPETLNGPVLAHPVPADSDADGAESAPKASSAKPARKTLPAKNKKAAGAAVPVPLR